MSNRAKLKSEYVDKLGGCCQICGYKGSNRSLVFHHIGPKKFKISEKKSKSKTYEELKNTMLLCANCHDGLCGGIPDIIYGENLILPMFETYGWGQEYCHIVDFKDKYNLSGKGVKVAILDTGIHEHKELIIEKHLDFTKSKDKELNVHGTFVAGIIAAKKNDFGICGISPDAEIYDCRVLDANGISDGWTSIDNALDWCFDNDIDIINCSFGSFNPPRNKDIWTNGIIVAASGNSGVEEVDYPARIDEVVAVGSISEDGKRSKFSNYGKFLDISAPGDDILSCGENNGMITAAGTSFAAPFISGVFALLVEYGITDKDEMIKKSKEIFGGKI